MSGTGSALLDTNIVIAYLKRDWAVRSQWQVLSNLYLPLTALGELDCGAYKAVRHDHVLTQIHDLLRVVILLTPTGTTAKYTMARSRPSWRLPEPRFPRMTSGSRRWQRSTNCRWQPVTSTSSRCKG